MTTTLYRRGRVRSPVDPFATALLVADDEVIQLGAHQISPIPNSRHSLHADEDSVVLLSVAQPR